MGDNRVLLQGLFPVGTDITDNQVCSLLPACIEAEEDGEGISSKFQICVKCYSDKKNKDYWMLDKKGTNHFQVS